MLNSLALRRALHLVAEGQGGERRPKRTWKKQVEKETITVGLGQEEAFY